MQTAKVFLNVLICASLLAACGLKGPLYLPTDEPLSTPDIGQSSEQIKSIDDEEEDKKEKQQTSKSDR